MAGRTNAAGYSGTPLAKKLGLRVGGKVYAVGAPELYEKLLTPVPAGVKFVSKVGADTDIVHVFATKRVDLAKRLGQLVSVIRSDAVIWASWPKKSAKVPTDVTEDVVREVALPLGLVDVKVCAVDETWSGLKLVIRKANREPGR